MFHSIIFEPNELEKLADYILCNKNIDLVNNVYFNRNTLIKLRKILNGSKPNNIKMNQKQFNEIIKSFLNSNLVFEKNTPSIILNDHDCIIASLKRDINSVNYLKDVNVPELIDEIRSLVKAKGYILTKDSPVYLRSDKEIALNSIKINPYSADYIAWDRLDKTTADYLCKELSETYYVMNGASAEYLLTNDDIILSSIKKNISSVVYSNLTESTNKEIFEYLLQHGYDFPSSYLAHQKLVNYTNPRVLEQVLISETYLAEGKTDEQELCGTRFSELISQAINITPKPSMFKELFEYACEKSWSIYRRNNSDKYNGIPRKIMDLLETNDDFDDIVDDEDSFFPWMEEILEGKYQYLIKAMSVYFDEYNGDNNTDKMNKARDLIFDLSALYISRSKEKYKKDRLLQFQNRIKKNFSIKKDNPYIIKRVNQYYQKKYISNLYRLGNKEFLNYVESLKEKYEELAPKDTIDEMIKKFLSSDIKKLENAISPPSGYNGFKKSLEAKKLINRLNKGYINFTDQELNSYRSIIEYNEDNKEYVYVGDNYTDSKIEEYKKYSVLERVFKNIKKDLIDKAREYNIEIDFNVVEEMDLDLPFTDEFYEFSAQDKLKFKDFLDGCFDSHESEYFDVKGLSEIDDLFKLWNIISDKGLVWFQTMVHDSNSKELRDLFPANKFMRLVANISNILELANEYNYDINNFDDLSTLIDLGETTKEQRYILGKEVVETLTKDRAFIDKATKASEVIGVAAELVSRMVERDEYTVPFIEGEHKGYHYATYDSLDNDILLAGSRTDACFRVLGNDNDFLHYCALDKNGFVIEILDNELNFVGRAAGFRNGNCVFINELRTINDVHEEGYFGFYDEKYNDIFETFKEACEDIINQSHENPDEEVKIDFVFVNAAYLLDDIKPNVDRRIKEKFAGYPVLLGDTSDWEEFKKNTPNLIQDYTDYEPRELEDEYEGVAFYTDYGNYDLICMASSYETEDNTIDIKYFKKMNFCDVKGVYKRNRSDVLLWPCVTDEVREEINKINGLSAYMYGEEMPPEIPDDASVFIGDNWYLAYDGGFNIISCCYLFCDENARIELSVCAEAVKKYGGSPESLAKKIKTMNN
jgi:hypothetical protein